MPKIAATLASTLFVLFLLTMATEQMAFGQPPNDEAAMEPATEARRLAEQELAQAQIPSLKPYEEQADLNEALNERDSSLAQYQNEIDEETNVTHPRALASILKNDISAPDHKVVDIDAENQRFKNAIDSWPYPLEVSHR